MRQNSCIRKNIIKLKQKKWNMIWDGTRNGTPNIEYGLYESWPHFSLKFALKMNLDFCS